MCSLRSSRLLGSTKATFQNKNKPETTNKHYRKGQLCSHSQLPPRQSCSRRGQVSPGLWIWVRLQSSPTPTPITPTGHGLPTLGLTPGPRFLKWAEGSVAAAPGDVYSQPLPGPLAINEPSLQKHLLLTFYSIENTEDGAQGEGRVH